MFQTIATKFPKYLNKRFFVLFCFLKKHIETRFFLQKCGTEIRSKDLNHFMGQKSNFIVVLQKPWKVKDENRALYFTSIVTKIVERDTYYLILLVGNGYANFDGINGHERSKIITCPKQVKH